MSGERIGVLCGGPSAEREISLRSGRAVYEALLSLGLPVVLVELSSAVDAIAREIKDSGITHAFIALHGTFGEDGAVQVLLEELGISYAGSGPEACHLAMDKVSSRRRWLAAGLPIPHGVDAEVINAQEKAKALSFPMMVKPVSQGSSFGVVLVESAEGFPAALKEVAQFGDRIIIEEYLPGEELTVGILEDRPLPVIQVVPKRRFYDYTAKYTPGQTDYVVPAPLPDRKARRAQELALSAHEALGCRSFSRVDMIWVAGRGPVLLELNAIPGMTGSSLLPKAAAAAGIGFPELCERMLRCSLDRQRLSASV